MQNIPVTTTNMRCEKNISSCKSPTRRDNHRRKAKLDFERLDDVGSP